MQQWFMGFGGDRRVSELKLQSPASVFDRGNFSTGISTDSAHEAGPAPRDSEDYRFGPARGSLGLATALRIEAEFASVSRPDSESSRSERLGAGMPTGGPMAGELP